MTPIEEYRSAAESVLALIEALSDQPRADGEYASAAAKRTLQNIVTQSVARAERGDLTDGAASAASLSRVLVDGNGPRDGAHPLFAAFVELDSARAALRDTPGSVTMLSKSALGELTGTDARGSEAAAGVLTPTRAHEGATTLVQLGSDDGRRFVIAFTDRASFDGWASSIADMPSASRVALGDLLGLAARVGAAGVAVNPFDENVVLSVDASGADLPADVPLSVGAAAHPDPRVLAAVRRAAAAVREVRRIFAVSVVEGQGPQRIVWIVDGDNSDERATTLLLAALGPLLDAADAVDLLPADDAFAQKAIERTSPVYART